MGECCIVSLKFVFQKKRKEELEVVVSAVEFQLEIIALVAVLRLAHLCVFFKALVWSLNHCGKSIIFEGILRKALRNADIQSMHIHHIFLHLLSGV